MDESPGPTVGKVPGLCLVTMPLSPEELEHLADELNLLGDHLAELHDRIDPDDADSLDSLQGALGHYNELAKIIDPEAAIKWPPHH
jgi:hypothetical protein